MVAGDADPDWRRDDDSISSPAPNLDHTIFKARPAYQLTLGAFVLAGSWSLLVWGSRIGLLTGPERSNLASWLRIGGSVTLGITLVFLAVLMWRTGSPSGWSLPTAWTYLAFNVLVWVPSAIRVSAGTDPMAFKAIHLVLAITSIGIASVAVWAARPPTAYSNTTSTQMASNTSAR